MRSDQVKISFGPARYDSPKAIRKQIEDSKQETQESTIQEIVNNPTLNIGGGSESKLGDVTSYIPSSRTGTADSDGANYDFINTTGMALDIGDGVILSEIDDAYYVVGITDRVGDITPVPLPAAAALSPNFPLDGTNLPFPIQNGSETGLAGSPANPWGHDFAYDMLGGLGLGTDAIIGYDSDSQTALNAFVRSTSTNVSLFAPGNAGANYALYVQNSGNLFQMNNTALYYKPFGSAWGNAVGTYGVDASVFDEYSQTLWYASIETTAAPYRAEFYRMASTDTAPVQVAAMNIRSRYDVSTVARSGGVATFTTAINHTYQIGEVLDTNVTSPAGFTLSNVVVTGVTANTFTVVSAGANVATTATGAGSYARFDNEWPSPTSLYAGHGYLILRNGVHYYVKAAGDDSPFLFAGTVPIASFNPTSGSFFSEPYDFRLTPNGDLSYIYKSTITTTWHLRVLNTSTFIVNDYDTGIPSQYSRTFGASTYNRDALQGHMHTESGLVLFPGIATDTELGEPTYGFYPALAAFNYVSSTYIYWDPEMVDSMDVATAILSTVPVEVATGTIRNAARSRTNQNPGIGIITRHYELSGL